MKKGVPRFGILDEGRKALIGLHGGKYSLWVFPYQPLKEKVPPEGIPFPRSRLLHADIMPRSSSPWHPRSVM